MKDKIFHILEHSSLPYLNKLDASSTVEVYVLSRHAELQNVQLNESFTASSDDETSLTLSVPKTGLGFRHIKKSTYRGFQRNNGYDESNSEYNGNQPISFELVLEYGPRKIFTTVPTFAGTNDVGEGTSEIHVQESMPQISLDDSSSEKTITWDNEGGVYYSTSIDRNVWKSAYFMAPITGAVLSKVLDYSAEYSKSHPRYQPFDLIHLMNNKENNENSIYDNTLEDANVSQLFPSSSSDDFVWRVISVLSDAYVNVNPIVIPPRIRSKVFVKEAQIVNYTSSSAEEKLSITQYYNQLYSCVLSNVKDSLGRKDIDKRYLSNVPSIQPSTKPIHSPSSIPTTISPFIDKTSTFHPTATSFAHKSIAPTSRNTIRPSVVQLGNGTRNLKDDVDSKPLKIVNMQIDFVLPCLSSIHPSGIGRNSNSSKENDVAYFYSDGENFWRANLTYPYLEISTHPGSLPVTKQNFDGEVRNTYDFLFCFFSFLHGNVYVCICIWKAQLIDWLLATAIMCSFVIGVIVVLQHMGLIRTFFRVNHFCGITSTYVRPDDFENSYLSDHKHKISISKQRGKHIMASEKEELVRENGDVDCNVIQFAAIELPIKERNLHTHNPRRFGKLLFGRSNSSEQIVRRKRSPEVTETESVIVDSPKTIDNNKDNFFIE